MVGRRPTPTALKTLRGNPGRRPLPAGEPQPDIATDDAPSALSGAAVAIWLEVAPQLVALRLLTVIDRAHLARACRLEALGRSMLDAAELQPIVNTPANGRQPSPEFHAALKAFDAADRVWFRFGFTPAERVRVRALRDEGQENPLAKLLEQKRQAARAT